MLLLLLPFAGLLLLSLFVIKPISTSTNPLVAPNNSQLTCPTVSYRISLHLLFVAWTSDFEMTSPLDHNVLKYKVGHTIPSYSSRFIGCNYGSWTQVRTAFSYGSLNNMPACCCIRVTCYQPDSEICMYVYRVQTVFLRCPTRRLHCILSSHWPNIFV